MGNVNEGETAMAKNAETPQGRSAQRKLSSDARAEAIESIRRILDAVHAGDLDATVAVVAALEGALAGLTGVGPDISD